jgi:hypothetical protein
VELTRRAFQAFNDRDLDAVLAGLTGGGANGTAGAWEVAGAKLISLRDGT